MCGPFALGGSCSSRPYNADIFYGGMCMRAVCLLMSVVGCLLASAPAMAAEPALRLTTHDLPPYGSYAGPDNRFDGIAVRVVDCALRRVGRSYELEVLPWARAQKTVQAGGADGFFAASQNAERDSYAEMSAIIAEQEWRWYLLAENPMDPKAPEFRQRATVGSFVGGNMLDWLKRNGYRVEASPANTDQLLSMLQNGRIDAVLANNLVMEELLKKRNSQGQLRSVLQENKPLGVYFSKEFLAKSPGFLSAFNRQVPACR